MTVAILKYSSCNLSSLSNCLNSIGIKYHICLSAKDLEAASIIILPGVGTFESVIDEIKKNGTYDVIKKKAKNGCKIIGICIGMQILAETGRELLTNRSKGLALIEGDVEKMKDFHIGWSHLKAGLNCSKNLKKFFNKNFYFNHSYYLNLKNKKIIQLYSLYDGIKIPSLIINKNIYGFQFHPEKSQIFGKKLLEYCIKENL